MIPTSYIRCFQNASATSPYSVFVENNIIYICSQYNVYCYKIQDRNENLDRAIQLSGNCEEFKNYVFQQKWNELEAGSIFKIACSKFSDENIFQIISYFCSCRGFYVNNPEETITMCLDRCLWNTLNICIGLGINIIEPRKIVDRVKNSNKPEAFNCIYSLIREGYTVDLSEYDLEQCANCIRDADITNVFFPQNIDLAVLCAILTKNSFFNCSLASILQKFPLWLAAKFHSKNLKCYNLFGSYLDFLSILTGKTYTNEEYYKIVCDLSINFPDDALYVAKMIKNPEQEWLNDTWCKKTTSIMVEAQC